jgi:hypothetical protein
VRALHRGHVMPVPPSDCYLLSNGRGGQVRRNDGAYYQIFNYTGGYNGCVDPMLPVFNRILAFGNLSITHKFSSDHGA